MTLFTAIRNLDEGTEIHIPGESYYGRPIEGRICLVPTDQWEDRDGFRHSAGSYAIGFEGNEDADNYCDSDKWEVK